MGKITWLEMLSASVFAAVAAMAGARVLMLKMERILQEENRFNLAPTSSTLMSALVGAVAGLVIASIAIYYYLFATNSASFVEWIGRSSYVLVAAASAGHLIVLIHVWIRLEAEERDVQNTGKGPQRATLSLQRRASLEDLKGKSDLYSELKLRDDESVEELVNVFGEPLLNGQRALSRIPFYGYLGTVCGILIVAQELTRLDEATETFQVLRDMAGGLVLAFQTTLVALLAYLPLRKVFDSLLGRIAALERSWVELRDRVLDGREFP